MTKGLKAAWLLVALAAPVAAASAAPSQPWVEFAADSSLSVRQIVDRGAACPRSTVDGAAVAMARRGIADDKFPIEVCEAIAPLATARLAVGDRALPVVPAAARRVVVLGDTGCRLAGRAVQDCNDPVAWPFATIARRAAARKPDLVIHVGDYYYRENTCPAGRAGCAGSPYGDNWPVWQAEFFDPAAPLLAAAPWVMVRGNHESCRRGGRGWFRLLDPRPLAGDCADMTEPYRVSAGGLNLLMFDSADADDFKADEKKIAAYAAQFTRLLSGAPAHSWLLTHRPVWAQAQGDLGGLTTNLTQQASIRGLVPDTLDMVVAGHLHIFAGYEFGPGRPAQLIVGTGGDRLLPLAKTPIVGAEIDGMAIRKGIAFERFGYFVMERAGDGWDGVFYGVDDAVLARCRVAGRDLDCR